MHKIRRRCGGEEGERSGGMVGGGGEQLIGKLKNKWRLGGRSETGFTCCCPLVICFTHFPQRCRRAKTPKDLVN